MTERLAGSRQSTRLRARLRIEADREPVVDLDVVARVPRARREDALALLAGALGRPIEGVRHIDARQRELDVRERRADMVEELLLSLRSTQIELLAHTGRLELDDDQRTALFDVFRTATPRGGEPAAPSRKA